MNIPNLLTGLRFLLIPCFVYEFLFSKNTAAAVIILLLSALTDFLDGYIARKFNMVTKWGVVFDPLADKLTQMTVAFCLAYSGIHIMWLVFAVLVIKEMIFICGGTFLFKKKDVVIPAKWYGKVATTLYYAVFFLLILFGNTLPKTATTIMVIVVLGFSVISFISYGRSFLKIRKTFSK